MKKLQICILFWSSRRKWCLCYLLFYWMWLPHFAMYLARFWLFLGKYPILERQISGCEQEKNMSHLVLVPKSQKSWGKSGSQKKWFGHHIHFFFFFLILSVIAFPPVKHNFNYYDYYGCISNYLICIIYKVLIFGDYRKCVGNLRDTSITILIG